jgi:hypothetical protein
MKSFVFRVKENVYRPSYILLAIKTWKSANADDIRSWKKWELWHVILKFCEICSLLACSLPHEINCDHGKINIRIQIIETNTIFAWHGTKLPPSTWKNYEFDQSFTQITPRKSKKTLADKKQFLQLFFALKKNIDHHYCQMEKLPLNWKTLIYSVSWDDDDSSITMQPEGKCCRKKFL